MPLPHQMILASAGSGKTFQLTNRLLTLIRAGVDPSKIIALTFSRNAAAEFLESLMLRLAEAGQSSKKAADLSRFTSTTNTPQLAIDDVAALLRLILDNSHQLHLETLDSFFFQIVNAFPFELGIEGTPTILQGGDVERARRDVIRTQLKYEEVDDERRRAFFESFKTASYGNDEKRVYSRLQDYINAHYPFYLSHPDETLWGDPLSIGIGDVVQHLLSDEAYDALVGELHKSTDTAVVEGKVSNQFTTALQGFIGNLSEWHVGKFSELFRNSIPAQILELAYDDSAITINYRKQSVTFSEVYSAKLKRCVRHIIAAECQSRLQATAALYRILHNFAQLYQSEVRNAGALTFDDVRMLLVPSGTNASNHLSLNPDNEANRLLIDYRLDSRFDHWLLDEFQDTSREQWAVLSNLIDEVLQAPNRQKSFFYVGDVKQAIYNWRGGDHKLFMEIFDRYQSGTNSIQRIDLASTYRCAEAIVELVNKIFSNLPLWNRDDQPVNQSAYSAAREEWKAVWTNHTSATKKRGYAVWIETANFKSFANQPNEENEEDTESNDPIIDEIFERLDALKPWKYGLTCAVICRTNKRVDSITRFLRGKGIPVAAESDIAFAAADPFSVALISLFQATAHPGDTLACEHLKLTPLLPWIESEPFLFDDLAEKIAYRGFAAAIDFIVQSLNKFSFPLSDFTKDRLLLWRRFSAAYDMNGIRDVDTFLHYIRSCRIQETPSANAVRVLTIHKSKGLGFDCVILPELQERSQNHTTSLLKGANPNGQEWVCLGVNSVLAEFIKPFRDAIIADKSREWFEDFCNLYVAITRAKHALYIITADRRKSNGDASSVRDSLWLMECATQSEAGEHLVEFPRIRLEYGNSNWINGLK